MLPPTLVGGRAVIEIKHASALEPAWTSLGPRVELPSGETHILSNVPWRKTNLSAKYSNKVSLCSD